VTTYDLNVDPNLQRKLTKANAAFSKVDYPSAVEVIDVLVRHRIATLLELWSGLIKRGEGTLKTIFLNYIGEEDGDFVVLLDGAAIHGLGFRLHEDSNWPGWQGKLEEVLKLVKDSLSSHGLLGALEDIGIKVAASRGLKPSDDVIIFESI